MKTIKLGILASINIALTFLISWYFIFFNGINIEADAFTASNSLPSYLLVLSPALSTVLIPILAKYSNTGFGKEVWNYLHLNFYFFGALTLILICTANYWVGLLLPGFVGEQLVHTIKLSQILLVGMLFTSFIAILTLANTLKNRFFWIEISSIIANVVALVFALLTTKYWGIYAIACATVIRSFGQMVLLLPVAGKYKKPRFKKVDLIILKKNLLPLLGGSIYYKTDVLIDRFFISGGSLGIITILTLSQQIYSVGNNILSKAVINPVIPSLANFAKEKKWKEYFRLLEIKNKQLIIITSIASILVIILGLVVYNYPISFFTITNDYLRKLFKVSILLIGFWIGGVVGNLTSNSFYVRGEIKIPTIISIINFTLFIIYKILLFIYIGYLGLIFSISIYYLASIIVHYFYIKKFKSECNKL